MNKKEQKQFKKLCKEVFGKSPKEIKEMIDKNISPAPCQKIDEDMGKIVFYPDIIHEFSKSTGEVFSWLLSHMDENHQINATNSTIAIESGASKTSVCCALRILKKYGLIERKGSVITFFPKIKVRNLKKTMYNAF